MLSTALSDAGHVVAVAHYAAEAERTVVEFSPEVAILDIGPGRRRLSTGGASAPLRIAAGENGVIRSLSTDDQPG